MTAAGKKSSLEAITIRQVVPADAEQIIALCKEIAAEPGINITYTVEEANIPVEKECEHILSLGNSLYIVAEAEGRIVGCLSCERDRWSMTGHVANLGMEIQNGFRNIRLGARMIAEAVAWAKATGTIKKIELEVFVKNAPAIHLYEKFGFEVEGRKRKSVYRDEEYLDTLIMGLLL